MVYQACVASWTGRPPGLLGMGDWPAQHEAAHLEGEVDDGDAHKATGGRDLGQESVH